MTAADDYPSLAEFASRPSGRQVWLIDRRVEARAALAEIDRLRAALRWALDCGAYDYQAGVVYNCGCGCCAEKVPVPVDLRDVFAAAAEQENDR